MPIRIKHARLGKLVFYTTRRKDMKEAERIVVGAFRIGEILDVRGESVVTASPHGALLRVRNFDEAPHFWDFHKQPAGPRWNTGLFRYLADAEADELLSALTLQSDNMPASQSTSG